VRAKLHLSEKYVAVQMCGRVRCPGSPPRRHNEYTNSKETQGNSHALSSWEPEGCCNPTRVNITTFHDEKGWINVVNLNSAARAYARSPTGDLADNQSIAKLAAHCNQDVGATGLDKTACVPDSQKGSVLMQK